MHRSLLEEPIVGGTVAPAGTCTVCRGAERVVVCTAAEVRRQFDYAKKFHRRRLRLIGRRDARKALADRGDYSHDYLTDLVACAECGLVFRAARPAPDTAAAEYAAERYGGERLQALFDSQLELFRDRIGTLQQVLRDAPRPAVVEVGSFVGGFLTAARELDWTAVGVDPGAEVADFCRARGLEVYRTVAEEAPIAAGSADCVAIWNTFDQLPDPQPTLAAAQRWLRPGGVLVVRVPNGACFRIAMGLVRRLPWHGPLLAALAWNNLLGFPYLYGYSPANLDRLLARFGFAPIVARPDTLVRLADDKTALWAAWEERLLKALWRMAFRESADTAPWFDAYYVRRD
jgi:SAM-dependent methyltransferase